jgi:hypothetical protein
MVGGRWIEFILHNIIIVSFIELFFERWFKGDFEGKGIYRKEITRSYLRGIWIYFLSFGGLSAKYLRAFSMSAGIGGG